MPAAALQAEVAAYIDQFADHLDENGHRQVVRNGYHHERDVLTAAGAVNVKVPRVNDKRIDPDTGERQKFSSAILPAWVRKSPQMNEVLPLLYLHGLSTSDFGPALEQFLGSGAGLSPTSITRLTTQWQDEAKAFQDRDLSGTDFVYLWVDGIHLKVRARAGETVPAGDDRGPCGRTKRARRTHRRVPRVDGVLGGSTAQLSTPRHGRTCPRGR